MVDDSTRRRPTRSTTCWNHSGQDKTNTFGLNAAFHLVPEKATLTFSVMDQNTDGFEDITANPTGTTRRAGRRIPST